MANGTTKGMAYLLVGKDKNWGKSRTLNALPGVNSQTHWIDIVSRKDGNPYPFFIRHMSNTDSPESFVDFIGAAAHNNIITAFSVGDPLAQRMLQVLSQNYRLRCFVLRHCWGTPALAVLPAEYVLLSQYAVSGGVFDYTLQNSPATARAAGFLSYMEAETPF